MQLGVTQYDPAKKILEKNREKMQKECTSFLKFCATQRTLLTKIGQKDQKLSLYTFNVCESRVSKYVC